MAREAGVSTLLHSRGKERNWVQMCAEETDLDCINPLEPPPMGDCDLAEIKRSFGHRLALMGNLHTTDVMLRGMPEMVLDASRQAIEVHVPAGRSNAANSPDTYISVGSSSTETPFASRPRHTEPPLTERDVSSTVSAVHTTPDHAVREGRTHNTSPSRLTVSPFA